MLLKSFKIYHSSWKLPDVDQLLDTFELSFQKKVDKFDTFSYRRCPNLAIEWPKNCGQTCCGQNAANILPKSSYYTFTLSAPQKGARSPVLGKKEAVRVSVEACWVL